MQVKAQQNYPHAHKKSDFISLHVDLSTQDQESDVMLTLIKRNTMHIFTHRFALILQLTFGWVTQIYSL